ADFPWRPANNINHTPFPEPVPYAGDKRIFMAEQFYDVQDPAYRKLHTAYIRKCLDNFRDNSGVLQLISAEYTGPLHFVQFWLDTIKAWENETGKRALVGLSTTKDVQDAILTDPARAAVVDVIDIRYWHYQETGMAYAPQGGQNLAPRQHARLLKPKRTSPEQVYRAVREYKQKFPAKAVMYSGDNWDSMGWAVLMAGGSLAALPQLNERFLQAAATMKPLVIKGPKEQWVLKGEDGYIIYRNNADPVQVALSSGDYKMRVIDPKTGAFVGNEVTVTNSNELEAQSNGGVVLWLQAVPKQKQNDSSTRR
ncbi:MAG TPA: DUF6298 domain-containing protein, partial [Flavisolibacter sp.]